MQPVVYLCLGILCQLRAYFDWKIVAKVHRTTMVQESAVSEKPAADKKPETQRLVVDPHAEDNSREQAVERGSSLADSSARENLSSDAQDIGASRSQAKAELDRLIQAEQNLPGLALWERPASGLHRDASGQIDQITDEKGNTFKFQHDASGNITSFTDRDGVEYKSENGYNFQSSDGKSLNGIFGIDEKTETIHFLGMEGHYEWRRNGDIVYTPTEQQDENQAPPRVPRERRLDNAVTALSEVTQNINNAHFWEGQKKNDLSATALSIVKDNRDHLDDLRAAYKKAHPDGDLDKDLLANTTGPARERLEKMLTCKDQAEFDAWEITNATRRIDDLAKNHQKREDIEPSNEQERAMQERILRETLNGLSPEQIERINTAYKQLNDGKSLAEALDCNPNISKQTKEALRIEMSGDSHYNQVLNLGYNALNHKDLALFKEAMRTGTAEEREAFAQQYANALPDVFRGKDLEIAQQYLKNGELDLATRIRENITRIGLFTNKGAIEHLLDGMSTQEHIDYIAGAQLQEQTEGLTPEQEKQRDFYKNVSESLKAAGDEKDVVRWNDMIMNGGSLVSDLLKQHGKGIDAIFNTIENMKPVDFARLHDPDNPDFRRQVIESLGTMLGGADLQRATELVDAQIRAEKYGDPETHRSLHESLVHKMADPPIDGERVLSSIVSMAPSDRERFRSDPEYQKQVRNDLRKMLGTESGAPNAWQTEMYGVAADKLLTKIVNGQEPKLEPIDRLLIASKTMTDCAELAKNIEEAYKADPTLKDRINNPQTNEDKQLADAFDLALQRSLLEKPHLANPDEFSVLIREGRLSIELKIALHDDFQGKLQEIAHASNEEKANLPERAFDGMTPEQRQVAENVAKDGLKPEHTLRAFVLGNSGITNDQIESMFAKMTPAQVQASKENYELAYGRNLNGDLLPKLNHEHFADVERLLSTELNPREMLADVVARDEKSKSGLAGYIAQFRDGTTMQSGEAASQFLRTVQDSESFKNLSPDMQRQLREYMEKSFTQQHATKEEIADLAVTSAVIGASVAAAVATGGTSLVAAAAFGAVGAAAQTVGKEALMGLDADPSVRWRQGVRGFVEGATGVIGVPGGIEAVRGGWLIKATADGFVSGGAGGGIEGAMDYDPNKSIADNAAHVGSAAADGAVQGAWSGAGFTIAGAGFASVIRAGTHSMRGVKHAPETRLDHGAPALSPDTPMDVIGRGGPESVESIPSSDNKNITEVRRESGSAEPSRVEVFAVDESGARSSVRQFSKENGIWLNERGEPMGTSMRVLKSGAIAFTGEVRGTGSRPFVGQTVDAQSDARIAAITVKPNGESFAQGKLNPGGDGFIAHYNTNNELQRLTVSIGTAQISRGADGIWRDAHNMPFGSDLESTANGIKLKPIKGYSFPGDHPNVRLESVELRRDGSMVKHYENPQANPDKIVPRDQNDFAVPDDDWEYKEWRGYIKPAVDGNGRELPGRFVEEIGSGKVTRDSDDRVLGARNAGGYDLRYSGHDPENLDAVEYWKDGKLEYSLQRSSSGKFDKVFSDGHREHRNVDRVSVDSDGSVTEYTHFEKTLPDGRRFTTWAGERHGTDGVTVHIDEFGHERVDASALKAERARFDQLNERLSGTDENRAQRFDNLAITWERHARENGVSEEEIANVYHNINKLMSADNAVIPLEDREVLAQQFMLSLANNNYIDQGAWQTCNVTAGHEVRSMVHRPSVMADILAQVATTGQYISIDGHIIDMKAATGTLFAQSDAVKQLGRPTVQDPANYSDLSPHNDGPSGRMYSDQILQSTLVNLFWQQQTTVRGRTFHGAMTIDELRAGQPYKPADLRYEIGSKTKSKPQSSRSVENLTDYSKVPPEALTWAMYQRPATNPLTGEKVPVIANEVVTSPQLNDALILQIDDYLYGPGAPKDHLILTDRPGNPRNVANEQELVNRLLDLKKQGGKFPVVVAVECSNIVDVNGVPNTSSGGHVINVHDIFESPPGSGKYSVYTTNQWGARFDYLEKKPLPTDELYRWMKRNDGGNVGSSAAEVGSAPHFADNSDVESLMDSLWDSPLMGDDTSGDVSDALYTKFADQKVPMLPSEKEALASVIANGNPAEAQKVLHPIAEFVERTAPLRQLMAKLKTDDPELSGVLQRAQNGSISDDEFKRTVEFAESTIALRQELAHSAPLYGMTKENWKAYQDVARQILENKDSDQAALLNKVRNFAQKNAIDLSQDDVSSILKRISDNDTTVTETMESYKGPRTREREAIRREFQDPRRIKPADQRLEELTTLKYDKAIVRDQLEQTRALINDARSGLADEIVQKLGLSAESRSALKAEILASDLSPRALVALSDNAKKDDAARIKEKITSKTFASELEPYPGTGSNAEYERLLTDMVVSSYVAQSNAPEDNADMQKYVGKIKDFIAKNVNGIRERKDYVPILIDGTVGKTYPFGEESTGATPINPAGRPSVCSAATAAEIQNRTLSPAELLERIEPGTHERNTIKGRSGVTVAGQHSGRQFLTAIVPVRDGIPITTAEHFQSHNGDRTGDVKKYTDKISNRILDNQMTPADGVYKIHIHGDSENHVYMAEIKNGIAQVYDPLRPWKKISTYDLNNTFERDQFLSPNRNARTQDFGIGREASSGTNWVPE